MRAFVIGSKKLSVDILHALIDQGIEVAGVYSRDDEPGMKIWHEQLGHPSLKAEAEKLGIPAHEGMKVNNPESLRLLTSLKLDIIVSCFWSELFKEPLLNIPKLGCYNFHTAALPKNRGSRPLPWAMINGEKQAGITCHRMMTGVDNGPIVDQEIVEIADIDTGKSLYDKVMDAGQQLAMRVFKDFHSGDFSLMLQDESQATYQPRGEPYGRQVNAFWDKERTERFRRAFEFPPFKGAVEAPDPSMKGTEPAVRMVLGLFHSGFETAQAAESISTSTQTLEKQHIPHTCFLTPEQLEHLKHNPLPHETSELLSNKAITVEALCSAKPPQSFSVLRKSLRTSAEQFNTFTGQNGRGIRVRTKQHEQLHDKYKLLDVLQRQGLNYVSSDVLVAEDGSITQPFRYKNGLLEIPSTDFFLLGETLSGGIENLDKLLNEASQAAEQHERDIFVGITIDLNKVQDGRINSLTDALSKAVERISGEFVTYQQICDHYNKNYE